VNRLDRAASSAKSGLAEPHVTATPASARAARDNRRNPARRMIAHCARPGVLRHVFGASRRRRARSSRARDCYSSNSWRSPCFFAMS
jgi:hypothetical protein